MNLQQAQLLLMTEESHLDTFSQYRTCTILQKAERAVHDSALSKVQSSS